MATVDQLLSELRRLGRARASELGQRLGVSQPTISRLITASGDRICRMGSGRAVEYAPTRSIPPLGTRTSIYRVDESGTVHRDGTLHFLASDHQWLEQEKGPGTFFEGLPPFAVDMSPQGFIGRSFSTRYPELKLPRRLADWSDDDRLVALALRGEDCSGNLILGDESLNRFLAQLPQPAQPDDYPHLAQASISGQPGSSAGGEQPKFLTYSEGRHVLVKFSGSEGSAALRWKDLLISESIALDVIRAEGLPAATARPLSLAGRQFLEVERFDRIGPRGRRALLSLGAIANEYLGHLDHWTNAARRLLSAKLIGPDDARMMRWLDAFGQLIGNTDRHFWNLSFFEDAKGRLQLTPVYDMLPMIFAPVEGELVERRFEPAPPTADNLDVWAHAARAAVAYWGQLVESTELSSDFRERCLHCKTAVEELIRRAPVA
ncbi:type II toxin-antitoxin system HipA family toxin YjjJ [Hyalangium versicolor]|uniref:type II toxin-antitoxin system HipA family toxin YjjJ n=1 Tax=Hyalangium versicolor TaxID=2861190 RepID=UPI001CCB803E|nr:type II toxin-antitoxin system HipA family toxin YjjJ [Hyalangium versicolor]